MSVWESVGVKRLRVVTLQTGNMWVLIGYDWSQVRQGVCGCKYATSCHKSDRESVGVNRLRLVTSQTRSLRVFIGYNWSQV
ncbi:hypothetical protein DPMN_145297 [Dreissena polymorpha]|uniref:Uncharacterized protein n=1 Tax=Dreissena polymorpha TaxID=45954 RepID=A0A9D4F9L3_DREPO|nr:hypothetical protein DPMN_145297 [Dreissena polymorpha]